MDANPILLEELGARQKNAAKDGSHWKLSVDEIRSAYAMGLRNFQDCFCRSDLRGSNLRDANLRDANLRGADLSGDDLSGSDLRDADLRDADLRGSNLRDANLRGSNLSDADLRGSDLRGSNLSDANLSDADLRGSDLTDAKGVLNPITYLETHFEWINDGLIAYKTFGSNYEPSPTWVIESGSVIEEVVNPCRGTQCGCGVNVGTRAFVGTDNTQKLPVWKVLIRNHWLAGIVVPFATDGKIRAAKVELVEIVG